MSTKTTFLCKKGASYEGRMRIVRYFVAGLRWIMHFFRNKNTKKCASYKGRMRISRNFVGGLRWISRFFRSKNTNYLSRRVGKFAIALHSLLLCCTAPTEDCGVHVGQFAIAPHTWHLFWCKTSILQIFPALQMTRCIFATFVALAISRKIARWRVVLTYLVL